MALPASSRFQFTPDLSICRILNGMWQVSGAHGRIEPSRAIAEMFAYHDAGFTTWDLADHYGPAEDFIGEFRREFAARHGAARLTEIQAFTKWVPRPGRMTRGMVKDAIELSLSRMSVKCLDLLQFHWWDYGIPAISTRSSICRLAARRQNSSSRAHQLRHRTSAHHHRSRHPHRVEPGAVLARRSPARGCDDGVLPRSRNHVAHLWHCPGRTALGEILGRPQPRRSELNTASLQKYRQHDRCVGRMGVVSGTARRAEDDRRQASSGYRQRRRALHPGPSRGGRRNRWHAARCSEHIADNARAFGLALDAEDYASIDRCSQNRAT